MKKKEQKLAKDTTSKLPEIANAFEEILREHGIKGVKLHSFEIKCLEEKPGKMKALSTARFQTESCEVVEGGIIRCGGEEV